MAKAKATYTPPANVNHMCLLQGQMVVYFPHLPPLLSLVPFHKILQSLPLLFAFTQSSPQLLSPSFPPGFSLCLLTVLLEKIKINRRELEEGDCEKDRKRRRVKRGLRSP